MQLLDGWADAADGLWPSPQATPYVRNSVNMISGLHERQFEQVDIHYPGIESGGLTVLMLGLVYSML